MHAPLEPDKPTPVDFMLTALTDWQDEGKMDRLKVEKLAGSGSHASADGTGTSAARRLDQQAERRRLERQA